jgi:hypothetical protein
MRKNFKFWASLFVASAFIISAGVAYATTYEELVRIYLEKEKAEKKIESEIQNESDMSEMDALSLWEEISREKDPAILSEKGIRLLDAMVGRDVSEWSQINGFLGGPEGYPKSTVVFSTALYTVSSLLEMGDPVSSNKALAIAKDLFKSRDTIGVIYRSSGKEAFKERGKLRELGGSKWIASKGSVLWNVNDISKRPYSINPVRKVKDSINISEAVSRKMVFLNSSGQKAPGIGKYAWDWKSGKVYRVRNNENSSEGRNGNSVRPDPSAGNNDDPDDNNDGGNSPDGNDNDNASPGGDDDDDDDDNGGPVGDDDDDDDNNGGPGGDDDDDDDDNGGPGGDDDDDDDDNGGPGGDDDDDDDDGGPGGDDDDDNGGGHHGGGNHGGGNSGGGNSGGSGPGNGNGNAGNPGNGGGNNNGSGPGSGNNGSNNGQGGNSGGGNNGGGDNGGGNNGGGNNGGNGPGNGNGNAGNPGNGGGNNNGSGPGSGNNGSNNGQGGGSGKSK